MLPKKNFFSQVKHDGVIEEILEDIKREEVYLYRHEGYWNTIETFRDKSAAEEIWEKGDAPWI